MKVTLDDKTYQLGKKFSRDVIASDMSVDAYSKGISHTIKKGDIEASLHELNKDEVDGTTKMTTLDMRTRLHTIQIQGMAKWDSVIAFAFLPVRALFVTRTMKRLMVSLEGKGREEMVNITRQNIEQGQGMGLWDRMKNVFVPQEVKK
jgi:hypothetical protein